MPTSLGFDHIFFLGKSFERLKWFNGGLSSASIGGSINGLALPICAVQLGFKGDPSYHTFWFEINFFTCVSRIIEPVTHIGGVILVKRLALIGALDSLPAERDSTFAGLRSALQRLVIIIKMPIEKACFLRDRSQHVCVP